MDLLESVDYRRFLRGALERSNLKGIDLAETIGRSKGWISMMLSGQRVLDPQFTPQLSELLGLSEQESHYFAALLDLHAPSARARQTAMATISAVQKRRMAEGLPEHVAVAFRTWYVLAVHELAGCAGFQADPTWIAGTLVPNITEEQAEQALRTLMGIGMLAPNEEGQLAQVPSEQLLWSPARLPKGTVSQAVMEAHLDHLTIAGAGLSAFHANERHVSGVTCSISEAQYSTLNARLHELIAELVVMVHERSEEPNRVYHLGVHLTPLSNFTDS